MNVSHHLYPFGSGTPLTNTTHTALIGIRYQQKNCVSCTQLIRLYGQFRILKTFEKESMFICSMFIGMVTLFLLISKIWLKQLKGPTGQIVVITFSNNIRLDPIIRFFAKKQRGKTTYTRVRIIIKVPDNFISLLCRTNILSWTFI